MNSPLLGADALPLTIVVGGEAFPIRSDFRDGIRFESMMYDERVPDGAKVNMALSILLPERPPAHLLAETLEAMLSFYRCGKPEAPEGDDGRQLYSFAHDYDIIYAAFLQAYGIDLLDPATTLHWWKFRAMLLALPEDCQFMRVVGYRAARVTSDMSREQRSHIRKMQRLYALPGEHIAAPRRIDTEEELDSVIAAIIAAKTEEGTP